jgi:hypothetical protein
MKALLLVLASVPHLLQEGPSCLATAAAAVLQSKGVQISPRELQRELFVSPKGVAWEDLARELERRKFVVALARGDERGLAERAARRRPFIVSQGRPGSPDHALVLEGFDVKTQRFQVVDPANPALATLGRAEVEQAFAASGRWVLDVDLPTPP